MEPQRDVYEPLNGLRGVAALCVLFSHTHGLLPVTLAERGYLAVDLFFCLSGFVIAHAYDGRLRRGLSAPAFLRIRLVRFYPLHALGLAIGSAWILLAILLSPPAALSSIEWLTATAAGALFMPVWFGTALFPLNLPAWSLLLELVVNFLYAAFFRFLGIPALLAIASAALLLLIMTSPAEISGGDELGTAHIGLLRAILSFAVGAAIYRFKLPKTALPPLPLIAVATLPMVVTAGPDIVVIALFFPLCIALIATCQASRFDPLFRWAGSISYALYAVHFPILTIAMAMRGTIPPQLSPMWPIIAIAVAHAAHRYFDVPVRRKLTKLPVAAPRTAE